MTNLNFNNTCPIIDDNLDEIENLILDYLSSNLTDDLMSDIRSPIEEVRATNIDMRTAANEQLTEKDEEITSLENRLADYEDELKSANQDIAKLEGDLFDARDTIGKLEYEINHFKLELDEAN